MSFFSSVAVAIKTEAAHAAIQLAPLWTALKPIAQATEQELASAALAAVIAQIPAVASGSEKFDAAAAQVVTALGSAGKAMAANLVTAAVQLAYNEVQTLRPAVSAAR